MTKSWCEWVAKRKPRMMKASTWKMTRARMNCAIRRREKIDARPTTTRKATAKITSPGAQVTWMHWAVLAMLAPALLMPELPNARPRALSASGT